MSIKNTIKSFLPLSLIKLLFSAKKIFFYTNYDSSEYWKSRAKEDGQSSVLWKNENFNNLYREKQKKIIFPFLKEKDLKILDIGCGTGYVSKMMIDINETIQIDAIDFEEMVKEAKIRNYHKNINYISSSAENYFEKNKKYDFIISSGCLSAIRDIDQMKKAMQNLTKMLSETGIILMIDPFHRWNYLARVKFNSSDVEKYMNSLGLELIEKSGVIFWPYREKYANSSLALDELKNKFEEGEKILHILGSHFWADYKILVFKSK